jgi:hypothetical protein
MIKKNNNRRISIKEDESILGGKKQLQSYLRVIVTATDKKRVRYKHLIFFFNLPYKSTVGFYFFGLISISFNFLLL